MGTNGTTTAADVNENIARITIHLDQAQQQTASARKEYGRAIKEARKHIDQAATAMPQKSKWTKLAGSMWAKWRDAKAAEKRVKAEHKKAQTALKADVASARADLKSALEADHGNDQGGEQTRFAWQALDEAEAGYKMALHECLDREEQLRKAQRHEFDNAKQLSLHGLEPDADLPIESATSGSLEQLKQQADDIGIAGVDDMSKAQLVHAIAHSGQTKKETKNERRTESVAHA